MSASGLAEASSRQRAPTELPWRTTRKRQLLKRQTAWLRRADHRRRIQKRISCAFYLIINSPIRYADLAFYGRGGGEKRCRGVGRGRGVIVGVTFGVAVGVGVFVAAAVALGVAVAVGVGLGVGVTLGVEVGVGLGVSVAVGVGLGVDVLSPNAATVPSL